MSLPFRKLALGGGGMKGILHIGALQELSKYQDLSFPDGIYGCSIGAIVATHIAFQIPVNHCVPALQKHLRFENIIQKLTFQILKDCLTSKGLFTMDAFESTVLAYFSDMGIDISNKTIGDAPQPLFIVASNLTKGVPTVFTKDVRILDALKCSCCIPGIFTPQELYGQHYVDGIVACPCISILQPDALILSLRGRDHVRKDIDNLSPIDFVTYLHDISIRNSVDKIPKEYIVHLSYPNLHSHSDLDDFNAESILEYSAALMRGFLVSKSLFQERTEIGDSRGTNHLV
uniref:PNPLA domain-containing protein n=1 Tax=viral metagenome TaxID=1070528 RepID=A0A6C0JVY8_9ZZZZ